MGGWFRMYDGVIDDHKVMNLPKDLRWDWVSVLCLASRHKGTLPSMSELAFNLRMTEAEALALVAKLRNAGLIETAKGALKPHNWEGRQYQSDSSRERTKRYRERHRDAGENVTVTPRARTDQTQTQTQNRTEDSSLRSESAHSARASCAPTQTARRRAAASPRTPLASLQNFERLKGAYPKRAGQNPNKPAFVAFKVAVVSRNADPEQLIAAAGKFASAVRADGKEKTRYVPQLATWLKQDRWSDDYTPEQQAASNGSGDKSVHRAADRLVERVQAFIDDAGDAGPPPLPALGRD
jgi:hypothetical protein